MSIEDRLRSLNERIETVKQRCGRASDNIRVVAVSKYASADEVHAAYRAGLRDFGESRVLEALAKMNALPKDICWHFIGSLQSNKLNKALGPFSLIHSVDSLALARLISDKSLKKNCKSSILLQVNTSLEAAKHGFLREELVDKFEELQQLEGLSIEGLMTMAPLSDDTLAVRRCFAGLRMLKEELFKLYGSQPSLGSLFLPQLSMGMSQDFPIAIEEGATLLRIGSYLFPKS